MPHRPARPAPSRRPAHALAAAIATVAALALIAACSSSNNDSDRRSSAGSTASSPATSKAATSPTITQHAVPTNPANDVSKRKQVTLTKCAKATGGWSATGTAKNSSAKAVKYSITVFFTSNGATVLDYAKTAVTVPAGKSQTWTASAKFAPTDPTLCVITGVA